MKIKGFQIHITDPEGRQILGLDSKYGHDLAKKAGGSINELLRGPATIRVFAYQENVSWWRATKTEIWQAFQNWLALRRLIRTHSAMSALGPFPQRLEGPTPFGTSTCDMTAASGLRRPLTLSPDSQLSKPSSKPDTIKPVAGSKDASFSQSGLCDLCGTTNGHLIDCPHFTVET